MEQLIKTREDEITLYDLGVVIMKRKKLIIGLFLCFLIVAIFISYIMPRRYHGEAIVMLHDASGITASNISELIGSKENASERLKIFFPKAHNSVTDLKFKPLKDTNDAALVSIEAKDLNLVQPLLLELVEYIKGLDYVRTNVKQEHERLVKLSTELDITISESSRLLAELNKLLKAGKLLTLGFNPVELNQKISEIKFDKWRIEQKIQKLKMNGGIEIANNPLISERPIKRSIIVLTSFAGLFLGIIVSLIIEFNKKIESQQ